MVLIPKKQQAQCLTAISSFPYVQSFESGNGNWQPNIPLHWEWGSIVPGTKSVITSAGGGQNCYISGGLSGAAYSSGLSYLVSPCFNFSTLINPEISFKIFWETERDFDGANLQYSIDEGASWNIVGSQFSNSNCDGTNWYNLASVRFIGFAPGWSGNIQTTGPGNCNTGGGSGQWLTARHTLNFLAGQSKVLFRFSFGAGLICNDYEGLAIDDIRVAETPPNSANFSFSCVGNNTVDFTNASSPCISTLNWIFGDPASGASNTSAQTNPSHTFSGPGQYSVTLDVSFSDGTFSTRNQSVTILNLTPIITNTIRCFGDANGAISTSVIGGNGLYTYNWNTNPIQTTSSISNLSGSTYTVTVSATGACEVSSSVTLTEPLPIQGLIEVQAATCSQVNGSISSAITGGTGAFTYLWSNAATTSAINALLPGTYDLSVTDANGCTKNFTNIVLINREVPATVNFGADTSICPGQKLILQPGFFESYTWQDGSLNNSYDVTRSGTYWVKVKNEAGCNGADTIKVTVDCKGIFFPTSFTPNGDNINESFGPVGDLSSLKIYSLSIFNRWGQRIFYSTNPLIKWNGSFNGSAANLDTYIWQASYRINSQKILYKKGTVSLLR